MRDLHRLLSFYRRVLLEDTIPFWMRHAVDPGGGLNTCIRDDGTVVSRDKWLWSQWRAVWVFSKLSAHVERRHEWLDLARHICRFAARSGWDEEAGAWNLRLTGDGQVIDGPKSIYTDGFAIYGLTELARAAAEAGLEQAARDEPIQLARKTADSVLRRLEARPDQIPAWPYPTPAGAKAHGIPMIFSLVFWELGQLTGEQRYLSAAAVMSDEVFLHLWRPDRDLLLERIALDNSEYPGPEGTTVVPGHVIEDMWFQMHIARHRGDRDVIGRACEITRRHLEIGWDEEFGGLFLAVDADGREDIAWDYADAKLWWPHTEALVATLLAHEHTGQDWALDWHERIRQYCLAHYPVADHGEWRQRLTRDGQPLTDVVALPVKDPFHLPRALIYCVEALERLTASESAGS